jgi:hypothetical protein
MTEWTLVDLLFINFFDSIHSSDLCEVEWDFNYLDMMNGTI